MCIILVFPASLLKGAAANLAIQALGQNLNKKNFLPTLLVGALGGGLSCLSDDKYCSTLIATSIIGGGNALINKTSVPKSLARFIIKVMDPLLGNITELSQSEFNNGKVRCINGR